MSDVNHSKQVGNIVEFSSLPIEVQNLLSTAAAAREYAYVPYSNFKVGAAIMDMKGKIYGGCNVENCSFTVGTCAERTAYVKAISEGEKKFQKVAVIAQQDNAYTSPCGACRQFMSEFGNVDIYISKPSLDFVFVTSLNELLPCQFSLT